MKDFTGEAAIPLSALAEEAWTRGQQLLKFFQQRDILCSTTERDYLIRPIILKAAGVLPRSVTFAKDGLA
jgi:hypothetical protein